MQVCIEKLVVCIEHEARLRKKLLLGQVGYLKQENILTCLNIVHVLLTIGKHQNLERVRMSSLIVMNKEIEA